MKRWVEIEQQIGGLEMSITALRVEWAKLQDECKHPNLPKREIGEEHMDKCPDCGWVSYCYEI